MTPNYTKKYVKRANAFGVFWEEKKDRKTRGFSKWFSLEEDADKFIKEKQDEENKREQI